MQSKQNKLEMSSVIQQEKGVSNIDFNQIKSKNQLKKLAEVLTGKKVRVLSNKKYEVANGHDFAVVFDLPNGKMEFVTGAPTKALCASFLYEKYKK